MEEWVGSLWHKYIVQKSNSDHDQARVELKDISKSIEVIYRAFGGLPSKRIEAAAPRDYIVQRTLVEKISGTHKQVTCAWQDENSLRLPQSIAIFPSSELNKELFIWLAILAAHSPDKFSHWAKDNQKTVAHILTKYPNLSARYQRLVTATLKLRTPAEQLSKTQQALELAVVNALQNPEQDIEFPRANYAPQAVFLWLYPSANMQLDSFSVADPDLSETENEEQSEKQNSRQARKKSERIAEDNSKDSLMVFRLESLFSWSEFSKVNRAEDDTDNDDAKRVAEDLDLITVSGTSKQKTSKLKIDLDLPSAIEDDLPLGEGITLPEWDYRKNTLVANRCLLQPMLPKDSKPDPLPTRLKSLSAKIRSQFEHLQSMKYWQRGQVSGDEIDMSAWLDFHVESKISATKEHGLYQRFTQQNRDVGCLLLSDISMSTDAHINNDVRVIDVIKDSLLLFGEALDSLGDRFAMYGFSSVKRNHVRFLLMKNFNEPYSDHVRGRIISLRPGFYTRMGAAIRQATNILAQEKHHKKLLLIVTDGKPNDIDHYEGRFGIEDTRQAILEAKRLGLTPFCITIDQEADQYLPYIFGSNGYTVILNPSQLPAKLPLLYHQLTE